MGIQQHSGKHVMHTGHSKQNYKEIMIVVYMDNIWAEHDGKNDCESDSKWNHLVYDLTISV